MSQTRIDLLGPATAQWNDYVGTAAADDCALSDSCEGLYRMAELNPAKWLITGVDFVVRDRAERLVVYAFDRQPEGIGSHTELLDIAEELGELPVVGFELTEPVESGSWLGSLFGQVALRLVARGLRDVRMVVTRVELRTSRT